MKTIAHFLKEPIKTHQRFIYNQIVIGRFPPPALNSEFPMRHYYRLDDIDNLQSFFKQQNVVAIHAHHGGQAIEILPVAIKHGIPLIVSIRGRDGSAQNKNRKINTDRYKSLIQHGACCLPVCQFLAEQLKKLGFCEDKIHVLYGGIDLDWFPYSERTLPEQGQIRILSVGRLVKKKGFPTLLKAFGRIHEKYPNTTLHIVGTGEQKQSIQSLIRQYKLESVVTLKGAMDLQQITTELKQAHLFCLASESADNGDVEGIPNALKEAMASGLPVISTRHGGIPELIEHGKTGYLAPEKDDKELAQGIEFFLAHPELWKPFTESARRVIEEHFDLNKQIAEQQKIYSLVEQTHRKTE